MVMPLSRLERAPPFPSPRWRPSSPIPFSDPVTVPSRLATNWLSSVGTTTNVFTPCVISAACVSGDERGVLVKTTVPAAMRTDRVDDRPPTWSHFKCGPLVKI